MTLKETIKSVRNQSVDELLLELHGEAHRIGKHPSLPMQYYQINSYTTTGTIGNCYYDWMASVLMMTQRDRITNTTNNTVNNFYYDEAIANTIGWTSR